MEIESSLVNLLALARPLGPGLEVPNAMLPIISLPMPMTITASSVTEDLRGKTGSVMLVGGINHGASTAPQSTQLATFDRGIYRIQGTILSTNFSGPAASSASPNCSRGVIYSVGTGGGTLAYTQLQASVPQRAYFDVTLHFPKPDAELWLETMVTTGVGETIGANMIVYVSQLM